MTRLITILCVGLFLLMVSGLAMADEPTHSTTLWLGGHYTDFTDYTKKVGEFNPGEDEFWPEFRLNYLSLSDNGIFAIDGHFYDDEDIIGVVRSTVGDRWKAKFQYRSLTKQAGQDLLLNLEGREAVGENPGGKIVTHEILDPHADYKTHRQELLSEINVLLSKKHNVRLIGAHRSILEKGEEQMIGNNHCFSCHVTSQTGKVDKRTHALQAGLQADVTEKVTVGYQFDYRYFESQAPDVYNYYDQAKHPVNGGSGDEFSSRQVFDDTSAAISTYPTTEKMTHKVRVKTDLGTGRLAGSVGYFAATNKKTDLKADGWTGAASYAVPLSPKTRLIAKAAGTRLWNDATFIDLPTFREGRLGYQQSFDYWRISSLDRRTANLSAEVLHRLNQRTTLSVKAGFDQTKRYNYPEISDDQSTDMFYGQVKMRYRKGLRYSTMVKYRFEKTSDPFKSARGLFESQGLGTLGTLPGTTFIFYFQREDLRYQDITTQPTDRHQFDVMTTYKPNPKLSVNVGLKGNYDKNGDLDSLDVNHFSLRPNISFTAIPDPRGSVTAGYTYNFGKSRGPVTVALFDG